MIFHVCFRFLILPFQMVIEVVSFRPVFSAQSLSDACDWVGLELPLWDAVAEQIGAVADLWHLAQLSGDQLRHAIGGARLSATEAAKVGLIWNVARAASECDGPRKMLEEATWYEVVYDKAWTRRSFMSKAVLRASEAFRGR